jgi:hypothetical protein
MPTMPSDDSQTDSTGLALPQFPTALTGQRSSLMQRAQAMRVQQEQLELEKQRLAGELAANAPQLEDRRARVARAQLEAEGARVASGVQVATDESRRALVERAAQAFGMKAPGFIPGSLALGGPDFHRDVDGLHAMPTRTPRQLADFTDRLAAVGSTYAPLAEAHPETKAIFTGSLDRLRAKAAGAVDFLGVQSAQQAGLLRTPLALVETPGQLTAFVQEAGDRHDAAMLDPEYRSFFLDTVRDLRESARAEARRAGLAVTARPTEVVPMVRENENAGASATAPTLAPPLVVEGGTTLSGAEPGGRIDAAGPDDALADPHLPARDPDNDPDEPLYGSDGFVTKRGLETVLAEHADQRLAWSTKNYNLLGAGFFPVHQIAIDRALSLPETDRQILRQAQVLADRDQTYEHQYRHAMRDGRLDGSGKPRQTLEQARQLANDYVRECFQVAIRLEKMGKHNSAMERLGAAIHTLQDSTSPAHRGFQPWGGPAAQSKTGHVTSERNYPGDDSELFRITQKAYRYFDGSEPLPDDFFP